MRGIAVAVLVASVGTVGALGDKPPPAPPDAPLAPSAPPAGVKRLDAPSGPSVQKLLNDLGSDDWRARERAGRALEAYGEKALPEMKAALLATESAEVQQRLGVLVRKMDRARLIEPKRVTFSAKGLTAARAYREIANQTGYRVEFNDGADPVEPKLELVFDRTPFWQALDAVADAVGHTVQADNGDESVRVYRSDSVSPYVAHAGPFRLVATNINSSRSVQLAHINRRGDGGRANEYVNLNFMIHAEPKNPMLGTTLVELSEARDDSGGSLLPPQERNGYRSNYISGGYRSFSTYMSTNLVRADRGATTIKALKGRVGIVLLAGSVPEVTVADPLKVKKQSFAGRGVQLDVDSVTEDGNQQGAYVVSLTAKSLAEADPNRGADYGWSNSLWQRLELTDEKGNRYFTQGPNAHNNNGVTVQMVLSFVPTDPRTGSRVALGPPKKLVLHEWLTVTHEVPFAFKDIPLP